VRALLAAALPHTGALRGALGAYLFPPTHPGALHVLPALTATAPPSLIGIKKRGASRDPFRFLSAIGDYAPGISMISIMSIVAPGICRNG
jgi:hypothetical protein